MATRPTTKQRNRRAAGRRPGGEGAGAEASSSLAAAATSKIRDRILDLTLRPGMQLDEALLRDRLGVSRTPAREALNRLATEGLVESRSSRGYFVRPLDLGDTARFFDAYLVAERSAAYFCRFVHPQLIEDLDDIQALHSAAVRDHDFLEISRHNAVFHLRIATATENPYIVDFSGRLHNLARRLSVFVYHIESDQGGRLDEQQGHIVREHVAIIDAIRAHDRNALLERLTAHADRFQQRISRLLSGQARERFNLR
ncbi:MAG: GntR family transcriptional regulator [Acetobacteraceae bacterium]|nr:GntR family transcriptional regulator [Acetobacteraceae bacterium]